jgi:hypothetical protein
MTWRSARITLAAVSLTSAVLLSGPREAPAGPGHRDPMNEFIYTSPANILRAQHALEHLGLLDRAAYSPGEYDAPTRRAIRKFQWDHAIRDTGYLDRDTFAMLPTDERPDQDDDGVPDAQDRCPATPKESSKGKWIRVGHDGCPIDAK